MSLGPDADGVKHSEGSQILRFQRRFRNGALCSLEVDLAEVRSNTFRPHFVWNGRGHKPRELIAWVTEISQVVATCAGVPIMYVFVYDIGRTETWLCAPNERRRRIARKDEPCRNPVSALVLAMAARFASKSEG
jgi:hypothetical protein